MGKNNIITNKGDKEKLFLIKIAFVKILLKQCCDNQFIICLNKINQQHQILLQFCERKGPETARKRRIVSEWTEWSAPVSHSIIHGKEVVYEHAERSEALCVNHIE